MLRPSPKPSRAPTMRFVTVKSNEQLDLQALPPYSRTGLVRQPHLDNQSNPGPSLIEYGPPSLKRVVHRYGANYLRCWRIRRADCLIGRVSNDIRKLTPWGLKLSWHLTASHRLLPRPICASPVTPLRCISYDGRILPLARTPQPRATATLLR